MLDPKSLTTTATIAVPKTPPTVASIQVGLDDATFLGTHATGGETLDLVLVDVARREIRKATIFTSARKYSYIQLMTVDIAPTQITFAGQFIGELRMPKGASIRSDVREVDACDAARGIECSHGVRTTTAAPVAGVIGAITIARK